MKRMATIQPICANRLPMSVKKVKMNTPQSSTRLRP